MYAYIYIYICVCVLIHYHCIILFIYICIYVYIYNSIHAYLVFSYMSNTGLIGAWILALVFFAMVVPIESN